MFILHYKIINTTPCNNITYKEHLSKYNTRKLNKDLWLLRNQENVRREK